MLHYIKLSIINKKETIISENQSIFLKNLFDTKAAKLKHSLITPYWSLAQASNAY